LTGRISGDGLSFLSFTVWDFVRNVCDLQFSKGEESKVQHYLSYPAQSNKIVDTEFAALKIKNICKIQNKIYQSNHNGGSK
jgi:hypothetical protein